MYTILICNSLFKKGCHRQQTHRRQCLIFFFQNKRNILIYMLLKYLYNNYRLSRLFLCSVPSKAFD